MKKKFISAYCFFVSIIFIFSIGIFAFNIFNEYIHGETRADKRFEYLCLSVKQLSVKKAIGSQEFYNQMENIIGSYEDFAAFKISYKNDLLISYPQINIEEIAASKFIKDYTQSFSAADGTFNIQAKLYILRPSDIGKYARISFLIILVVTIITILLIIVLAATEKNAFEEDAFDLEEDKSKINFKNELESPEQILSSMQKNPEVEAEEKKEEENPIKEEKFPLEENKESIQTNDKVINININLDQNSKKSEESAEKEEVKLPVEDVKPMEIKKENPKGLFSPTTGLGWESYFKTRLENELNRAISSEIDLALFIIKIPGISRGNVVIKEIADYLITQFQFKDLLFEYKDDSIAAIKIGTNTDQALTLAETIAEDINKLLQDYPTKAFIGISTRTIRMMSAERLLKEADEALMHAQEEEDSPIIAFRADAVKYQKFLENNCQ